MQIHFASPNDLLVEFLRTGLAETGKTFSLLRNPDDITRLPAPHTEQIAPAPPAPQADSPFTPTAECFFSPVSCVVVDTEGPLAQEMLHTASACGYPLAALVKTKHHMPGALALPPETIRIRKPFCLAAIEQAAVLASRVRRNLPPEELHVGDMLLIPSSGATFRAGIAIPLHPREALLLEMFMRSPGEIIAREHILRMLFDYTARPRPNLVDVLACRLRSRLHVRGTTPALRTIRGKGYVLIP